jgi:hypothetical protein
MIETMDDVRRELRGLLDQEMGAAPRGTVVRNNELIAAFRQLEAG